jgi:hypothetical protein
VKVRNEEEEGKENKEENNEEEKKAGQKERGEKRKIKCIWKSYALGDITPCSLLKVHPTFRRNMSLPSSGSKNMPSKTPA